MSEQEKIEQIGRVAAEYSDRKGELNHIEEKAAAVQRAYEMAANGFGNLRVSEGALTIHRKSSGAEGDVGMLLNTQELAELLEERDELRSSVKVVGDRLRALAPHLL